MRPARGLLPSSILALEGRVVLSQVLNLTLKFRQIFDHPPAVSQCGLQTSSLRSDSGRPEPPLAAPTGGNTFPLSIGGTQVVGLPVYEQRETLYTHPATA